MNYNKRKITDEQLSYEERKIKEQAQIFINILNRILNYKQITELKRIVILEGYDNLKSLLADLSGIKADEISELSILKAIDEVIDIKDLETIDAHHEFALPEVHKTFSKKNKIPNTYTITPHR